MPRRSKTEAGNIFEIPLADGGYVYGMVIKAPLAAFFDFRFSERPSIDLIVSQPVAFRIWIMHDALGKRGWKVIGAAPVSEALAAPVVFYKFDMISRKFSLYSSPIETPATREQCVGLECAAVWSACHVESRLADHFAGRPFCWPTILLADPIALSRIKAQPIDHEGSHRTSKPEQGAGGNGL